MYVILILFKKLINLNIYAQYYYHENSHIQHVSHFEVNIIKHSYVSIPKNLDQSIFCDYQYQ